MFPLCFVAYQYYLMCLRSSTCGRVACRDMFLTSYTPQKIDMNLLSTAAQILAICTKGPCKRRGGGNQWGLPSGYWQQFSHWRSHDFSMAILASSPIFLFFFFFPLSKTTWLELFDIFYIKLFKVEGKWPMEDKCCWKKQSFEKRNSGKRNKTLIDPYSTDNSSHLTDPGHYCTWKQQYLPLSPQACRFQAQLWGQQLWPQKLWEWDIPWGPLPS